MLVRIFKYWNNLDILRLTPGTRGRWGDVQFVVEKSGRADYVMVHCHAGRPAWVKCARENIWLMMGEPPNEHYKDWHRGAPWMGRVYTSDDDLIAQSSLETQTLPRHVRSYAGVPWHVDKDFDYLNMCSMPEKTDTLAWITSTLAFTDGHAQRMQALEKLKDLPELQLFGRGIRPIRDKWDALAPSRYAIAYENFSNASYWTEKVADCFLAWTMPLYYGCTELEQYFPPESFVRIDPNWPDLRERVRAIVNSDVRERNLDAIAEARRRVLYDHNLFEFLTREIKADQAQITAPRTERITLIRDHTRTAPQAIKENLNALTAQIRIRAGAMRRGIGAKLR